MWMVESHRCRGCRDAACRQAAVVPVVLVLVRLLLVMVMLEVMLVVEWLLTLHEVGLLLLLLLL